MSMSNGQLCGNEDEKLLYTSSFTLTYSHYFGECVDFILNTLASLVKLNRLPRFTEDFCKVSDEIYVDPSDGAYLLFTSPLWDEFLDVFSMEKSKNSKARDNLFTSIQNAINEQGYATTKILRAENLYKDLKKKEKNKALDCCMEGQAAGENSHSRQDYNNKKDKAAALVSAIFRNAFTVIVQAHKEYIKAINVVTERSVLNNSANLFEEYKEHNFTEVTGTPAEALFTEKYCTFLKEKNIYIRYLLLRAAPLAADLVMFYAINFALVQFSATWDERKPISYDARRGLLRQDIIKKCFCDSGYNRYVVYNRNMLPNLLLNALSCEQQRNEVVNSVDSYGGFVLDWVFLSTPLSRLISTLMCADIMSLHYIFDVSQTALCRVTGMPASKEKLNGGSSKDFELAFSTFFRPDKNVIIEPFSDKKIWIKHCIAAQTVFYHTNQRAQHIGPEKPDNINSGSHIDCCSGTFPTIGANAFTSARLDYSKINYNADRVLKCVLSELKRSNVTESVNNTVLVIAWTAHLRSVLRQISLVSLKLLSLTDEGLLSCSGLFAPLLNKKLFTRFFQKLFGDFCSVQLKNDFSPSSGRNAQLIDYSSCENMISVHVLPAVINYFATVFPVSRHLFKKSDWVSQINCRESISNSTPISFLPIEYIVDIFKTSLSFTMNLNMRWKKKSVLKRLSLNFFETQRIISIKVLHEKIRSFAPILRGTILLSEENSILAISTLTIIAINTKNGNDINMLAIFCQFVIDLFGKKVDYNNISTAIKELIRKLYVTYVSEWCQKEKSQLIVFPAAAILLALCPSKFFIDAFPQLSERICKRLLSTTQISESATIGSLLALQHLLGYALQFALPEVEQSCRNANISQTEEAKKNNESVFSFAEHEMKFLKEGISTVCKKISSFGISFLSKNDFLSKTGTLMIYPSHAPYRKQLTLTAVYADLLITLCVLRPNEYGFPLLINMLPTDPKKVYNDCTAAVMFVLNLLGTYVFHERISYLLGSKYFSFKTNTDHEIKIRFYGSIGQPPSTLSKWEFPQCLTNTYNAERVGLLLNGRKTAISIWLCASQFSFLRVSNDDNELFLNFTELYVNRTNPESLLELRKRMMSLHAELTGVERGLGCNSPVSFTKLAANMLFNSKMQQFLSEDGFSYEKNVSSTNISACENEYENYFLKLQQGLATTMKALESNSLRPAADLNEHILSGFCTPKDIVSDWSSLFESEYNKKLISLKNLKGYELLLNTVLSCAIWNPLMLLTGDIKENSNDLATLLRQGLPLSTTTFDTPKVPILIRLATHQYREISHATLYHIIPLLMLYFDLEHVPSCEIKVQKLSALDQKDFLSDGNTLRKKANKQPKELISDGNNKKMVSKDNRITGLKRKENGNSCRSFESWLRGGGPDFLYSLRCTLFGTLNLAWPESNTKKAENIRTLQATEFLFQHSSVNVHDSELNSSNIYRESLLKRFLLLPADYGCSAGFIVIATLCETLFSIIHSSNDFKTNVGTTSTAGSQSKSPFRNFTSEVKSSTSYSESYPIVIVSLLNRCITMLLSHCASFVDPECITGADMLLMRTVLSFLHIGMLFCTSNMSSELHLNSGESSGGISMDDRYLISSLPKKTLSSDIIPLNKASEEIQIGEFEHMLIFLLKRRLNVKNENFLTATADDILHVTAVFCMAADAQLIRKSGIHLCFIADSLFKAFQRTARRLLAYINTLEKEMDVAYIFWASEQNCNFQSQYSGSVNKESFSNPIKKNNKLGMDSDTINKQDKMDYSKNMRQPAGDSRLISEGIKKRLIILGSFLSLFFAALKSRSSGEISFLEDFSSGSKNGILRPLSTISLLDVIEIHGGGVLTDTVNTLSRASNVSCSWGCDKSLDFVSMVSFGSSHGDGYIKKPIRSSFCGNFYGMESFNLHNRTTTLINMNKGEIKTKYCTDFFYFADQQHLGRLNYFFTALVIAQCPALIICNLLRKGLPLLPISIQGLLLRCCSFFFQTSLNSFSPFNVANTKSKDDFEIAELHNKEENFQNFNKADDMNKAKKKNIICLTTRTPSALFQAYLYNKSGNPLHNSKTAAAWIFQSIIAITCTCTISPIHLRNWQFFFFTAKDDSIFRFICKVSLLWEDTQGNDKLVYDQNLVNTFSAAIISECPFMSLRSLSFFFYTGHSILHFQEIINAFQSYLRYFFYYQEYIDTITFLFEVWIPLLMNEKSDLKFNYSGYDMSQFFLEFAQKAMDENCTVALQKRDFKRYFATSLPLLPALLLALQAALLPRSTIAFLESVGYQIFNVGTGVNVLDMKSENETTSSRLHHSQEVPSTESTMQRGSEKNRIETTSSSRERDSENIFSQEAPIWDSLVLKNRYSCTPTISFSLFFARFFDLFDKLMMTLVRGRAGSVVENEVYIRKKVVLYSSDSCGVYQEGILPPLPKSNSNSAKTDIHIFSEEKPVDTLKGTTELSLNISEFASTSKQNVIERRKSLSWNESITLRLRQSILNIIKTLFFVGCGNMHKPVTNCLSGCTFPPSDLKLGDQFFEVMEINAYYNGLFESITEVPDGITTAVESFLKGRFQAYLDFSAYHLIHTAPFEMSNSFSHAFVIPGFSTSTQHELSIISQSQNWFLTGFFQLSCSAVTCGATFIVSSITKALSNNAVISNCIGTYLRHQTLVEATCEQDRFKHDIQKHSSSMIKNNSDKYGNNKDSDKTVRKFVFPKAFKTEKFMALLIDPFKQSSVHFFPTIIFIFETIIKAANIAVNDTFVEIMRVKSKMRIQSTADSVNHSHFGIMRDEFKERQILELSLSNPAFLLLQRLVQRVVVQAPSFAYIFVAKLQQSSLSGMNGGSNRAINLTDADIFSEHFIDRDLNGTQYSLCVFDLPQAVLYISCIDSIVAFPYLLLGRSLLNSTICVSNSVKELPDSSPNINIVNGIDKRSSGEGADTKLPLWFTLDTQKLFDHPDDILAYLLAQSLIVITSNGSIAIRDGTEIELVYVKELRKRARTFLALWVSICEGVDALVYLKKCYSEFNHHFDPYRELIFWLDTLQESAKTSSTHFTLRPKVLYLRLCNIFFRMWELGLKTLGLSPYSEIGITAINNVLVQPIIDLMVMLPMFLPSIGDPDTVKSILLFDRTFCYKNDTSGACECQTGIKKNIGTFTDNNDWLSSYCTKHKLNPWNSLVRNKSYAEPLSAEIQLTDDKTVTISITSSPIEQFVCFLCTGEPASLLLGDTFSSSEKIGELQGENACSILWDDTQFIIKRILDLGRENKIGNAYDLSLGEKDLLELLELFPDCHSTLSENTKEILFNACTAVLKENLSVRNLKKKGDHNNPSPVDIMVFILFKLSITINRVLRTPYAVVEKLDLPKFMKSALLFMADRSFLSIEGADPILRQAEGLPSVQLIDVLPLLILPRAGRQVITMWNLNRSLGILIFVSFRALTTNSVVAKIVEEESYGRWDTFSNRIVFYIENLLPEKRKSVKNERVSLRSQNPLPNFVDFQNFVLSEEVDDSSSEQQVAQIGRSNYRPMLEFLFTDQLKGYVLVFINKIIVQRKKECTNKSQESNKCADGERMETPQHVWECNPSGTFCYLKTIKEIETVFKVGNQEMQRISYNKNASESRSNILVDTISQSPENLSITQAEPTHYDILDLTGLQRIKLTTIYLHEIESELQSAITVEARGLIEYLSWGSPEQTTQNSVPYQFLLLCFKSLLPTAANRKSLNYISSHFLFNVFFNIPLSLLNKEYVTDTTTIPFGAEWTGQTSCSRSHHHLQPSLREEDTFYQHSSVGSQTTIFCMSDPNKSAIATPCSKQPLSDLGEFPSMNSTQLGNGELLNYLSEPSLILLEHWARRVIVSHSASADSLLAQLNIMLKTLILKQKERSKKKIAGNREGNIDYYFKGNRIFYTWIYWFCKKFKFPQMIPTLALPALNNSYCTLQRIHSSIIKSISNFETRKLRVPCITNDISATYNQIFYTLIDDISELHTFLRSNCVPFQLFFPIWTNFYNGLFQQLCTTASQAINVVSHFLEFQNEEAEKNIERIEEVIETSYDALCRLSKMMEKHRCENQLSGMPELPSIENTQAWRRWFDWTLALTYNKSSILNVSVSGKQHNSIPSCMVTFKDSNTSISCENEDWNSLLSVTVGITAAQWRIAFIELVCAYERVCKRSTLHILTNSSIINTLMETFMESFSEHSFLQSKLYIQKYLINLQLTLINGLAEKKDLFQHVQNLVLEYVSTIQACFIFPLLYLATADDLFEAFSEVLPESAQLLKTRSLLTLVELFNLYLPSLDQENSGGGLIWMPEEGVNTFHRKAVSFVDKRNDFTVVDPLKLAVMYVKDIIYAAWVHYNNKVNSYSVNEFNDDQTNQSSDSSASLCYSYNSHFNNLLRIVSTDKSMAEQGDLNFKLEQNLLRIPIFPGIENMSENRLKMAFKQLALFSERFHALFRSALVPRNTLLAQLKKCLFSITSESNLNLDNFRMRFKKDLKEKKWVLIRDVVLNGSLCFGKKDFSSAKEIADSIICTPTKKILLNKKRPYRFKTYVQVKKKNYLSEIDCYTEYDFLKQLHLVKLDLIKI